MTTISSSWVRNLKLGNQSCIILGTHNGPHSFCLGPLNSQSWAWTEASMRDLGLEITQATHVRGRREGDGEEGSCSHMFQTYHCQKHSGLKCQTNFQNFDTRARDWFQSWPLKFSGSKQPSFMEALYRLACCVIDSWQPSEERVLTAHYVKHPSP